MIKTISLLELFNAKVQRAEVAIALFGFSDNEYRLEEGHYKVVDGGQEDYLYINSSGESCWFESDSDFIAHYESLYQYLY